MTDTENDVVFEPEDDGAEERFEQQLKKLREELKKVKTERDDYLAGWQRSKADYVNLSRRAREDEARVSQSGVLRFAQSIISVFDSLEAAHKAAEPEGGAVFSGISQVVKQLEAALKEHGISRFTPKEGDSFNPEKHEPIQTVATESEKEDNTVAETLQSGYEISGAVVRPARVTVKKLG